MTEVHLFYFIRHICIKDNAVRRTFTEILGSAKISCTDITAIISNVQKYTIKKELRVCKLRVCIKKTVVSN